MRRDFCNPINIPYKFQHYQNQASREAADPTLVYFKGKYYGKKANPTLRAGWDFLRLGIYRH